MSASKKPSVLVGSTVSMEGCMTLPEMLLDCVNKHPDKGTNYISHDGSERFQTYGELLAEAETALRRLRALGLKAGDPVLIEIEDDRIFYRAFWACLLGGMIPAAVNAPGSFSESSAGLLKILGIARVLEPAAIVCDGENKPSYAAAFRGAEDDLLVVG